MIPLKYLQNALLAPVVMWLITACQGGKEQPSPVVKPTATHQSTKEKTVVVPPEVASRWKAVKIAIIDKSLATENVYIVPIGGSSSIPSSNLVITVEAFLPTFVIEGSSMTSSSNELKNPGVKVRITDNDSLIYKGWLFSNFPNTHAFMHPKFSFTVVGAVPVKK